MQIWVSKFPVIYFPSRKQLRLDEFSPSGTVLSLNSEKINNQGQLKVFTGSVLILRNNLLIEVQQIFSS